MDNFFHIPQSGASDIVLEVVPSRRFVHLLRYRETDTGKLRNIFIGGIPVSQVDSLIAWLSEVRAESARTGVSA